MSDTGAITSAEAYWDGTDNSGHLVGDKVEKY